MLADELLVQSLETSRGQHAFFSCLQVFTWTAHGRQDVPRNPESWAENRSQRQGVPWIDFLLTGRCITKQESCCGTHMAKETVPARRWPCQPAVPPGPHNMTLPIPQGPPCRCLLALTWTHTPGPAVRTTYSKTELSVGLFVLAQRSP